MDDNDNFFDLFLSFFGLATRSKVAYLRKNYWNTVEENWELDFQLKKLKAKLENAKRELNS